MRLRLILLLASVAVAPALEAGSFTARSGGRGSSGRSVSGGGHRGGRPVAAFGSRSSGGYRGYGSHRSGGRSYRGTSRHGAGGYGGVAHHGRSGRGTFTYRGYGRGGGGRHNYGRGGSRHGYTRHGRYAHRYRRHFGHRRHVSYGGYGGYGYGGGVGVRFGYGHHSGLSFGIAFGYPYFYSPSYVVSYAPPPVVYSSTTTIARTSGSRAGGGRIKTDVEPKSAVVYLDGEAVGIADDFDGYPSKLYVAPGEHEAVFREPGREPLRVTVDVLPYREIRIKERMLAGRDELASGYRVEPPASAPPPAASGMYSGMALSPGLLTALVLQVEPSDASVYVDGRLVSDRGGVGERLTVELAPGEHQVEVVRPGYQPFSARLELGERQRQDLTIRLNPAGDS